MEVAPVLYLAADVSTPHVVAIGDRDVVTRPAFRVALFDSSTRLPDSLSKALCLTLFFRFLIATVSPPGLLSRKPRVIVRGVASLAPMFAGYERDLLRHALEEAGARTVDFADGDLRA